MGCCPMESAARLRAEQQNQAHIIAYEGASRVSWDADVESKIHKIAQGRQPIVWLVLGFAGLVPEHLSSTCNCYSFPELPAENKIHCRHDSSR